MSHTVLITGSEPRASQMAKKIEKVGFQTLVSPLLKIADHTPDVLQVANVQAVVITSHHALEAARKFQHLPLAVIGKATAQSAISQGFSVLFHAVDVQALCTQLRQDLSPRNGGILYLAGTEVSANLTTFLPGFNLTKVVVYDALEQPLTPEAVKALQSGTVSFVTLLSSRTAEIFRQQVTDLKLTKNLSRSIAICFSEQIAQNAQLLPWQHVLVTPQPDEGNLLEVLRMFVAKPI